MRLATIRADSLLMTTALIWGVAFVFQRTGMEHVGPMTFNAVRFLLGSAVLIPLTVRTRRHFRPVAGLPEPGLKTYLLGGLAAGAVLFGGAALQQAGLVTTTAGKAGFITGLYVVITPLMGLAFRQRPGWGTWLGASLAAAGLYLLSVEADFSIAPGDLLVLVGAFFWAGHMLVIGWLSPRMDPVTLASAQFAVCGLLSLAAGLILEPVSLAGIRGASTAILYCGLGSVGVAYTLQVVAQREANPAHASVILSLEAVFAAVAGWIILGEVMDARALTGCGLMLSGMLFSQYRP